MHHLLLSALCFAPLASYAAGLDATGQPQPVHDGDVNHGGLVAAAPLLYAGQASVGLSAGLHLSSLTRVVNGETEQLVGTAGVARLNLAAAPLRWLTVSGSLPVRIGAQSDVGATGPALGDTSVALGVRPLHTHNTSVALQALALLPTGNLGQYASSGRWIPGARLSAHTTASHVSVAASVDLTHEGQPEPVNATGGAVHA